LPAQKSSGKKTAWLLRIPPQNFVFQRIRNQAVIPLGSIGKIVSGLKEGHRP